MKKLLHMREKTMKKTSYKKLQNLIISLLVVCLLSLSGCGSDNIKEINIAKQDHDFDLTPCKKPNGQPFKIAFMDLGPPIESSYLCLKGFVEGLQQLGYINETIDFSKAPEEFYGYYDYLTASDIGDYVSFEPEPYMIDEGDNKELGDMIQKKVTSGELDVIVATGTDPGLFLKSLDLPIPFLVCLATDPVASGIIDSAENTGNDKIWALVEPNPYGRQFEGYQSMLNFQKIGFVFIDEYDLIAGNSEYMNKADELSIDYDVITFTEKESMSEDFDDKLLQSLKEQDMSDYDAVLFAYGTMNDNNAPMISDYMATIGVPSLVGDGDSISKNGGMMCLSCFDYESYGNYASMVISNVFHGENAGDQPCVFNSSPHIVMNLTCAQKTGFKVTVDLLNSIDKIYR